MVTLEISMTSKQNESALQKIYKSFLHKSRNKYYNNRRYNKMKKQFWP